ncbi:uncharacterized protein LOC126736360 [Anthonomus grandis grandis]|uniref:uncharacterized protein LOC126736360 n=1 Tax=Anthonomus grandis grandis TaxID=2921223 RepID=UPI0021653CB0|nr:uncharacterized protein LOC126736360 [Anthonomus grandis grandis]
MEPKPNYYSNPAFCQQSEYLPQKRALSPQRDHRLSPIGAQSSHVVFDNSLSEIHDNLEEDQGDNIEEQEFYEEVIVDKNGFIQGKKFVVVAQNNEGQKYIQVPQEDKKGSRYGSSQQIHHYTLPKSPTRQNRYEYIPMQEQDPRVVKSSPKQKQVREEHVEVVPGIVHRYAVIEAEEETELTNKNERYALVPVNQLNNIVSPQNNPSRYDYIQDHAQKRPANRYEYIQNTPPKPTGIRYEYIQQSTPQKTNGSRYEFPTGNSPRPGTNPVATQKLHEILSTPKKVRTPGAGYQGQTPQKVVPLSPHHRRRMASPPLSPIPKDPFQTPRNSPQRPSNPKIQQKLNYALGSKTFNQPDKTKRNTAIVPPMCSSPVHSIYGETTYSQKSESWMNLSTKTLSRDVSLVYAAFIMFLCGVVTAGLSFYMLSFMGRPYYLDFSTVAGFACALMGLLGCRSRNVYWLPNRNYLSGYLVLSLFSLLTCGGLVVLLLYDPPPGTALADMTSSAVCGFSALTLLLACAGVVSSYCCKYPPPDNRVQHCSPGLTV